MNRSNRIGVGLVVVLAVSVTGRASSQTVDETETVVAVQVPVQVMLDGKPLPGLSADNFEILEGRKTREITGFDVVDLYHDDPAGTRSPSTAVPAYARRKVLLLFDFSFAEPASVLRARNAADEVVASGLHPTDVVAVAVYSARFGPRILLGFTSDREQARAAIRLVGSSNRSGMSPDPLGLTVLDPDNPSLEHATSETGIVDEGMTAGADALATESMREAMRGSETLERENRRNRITTLARDLSEVAKLLNSVEGRKHVVYFSEGFDSSLLFAERDPEASEEMNQAVELGELWKIDSERRFGSSRTRNLLESMVEEFRIADCVVEPVDIRGLRVDPDSGFNDSDGLFLMASGTGGEVHRNLNDLDRAMVRMLERTSLTYYLTFEPRDLVPDGSYHALKVKLKNVPKRARIVHRPGYYAPLPFSERTELQRTLGKAQVVLGDRGSGIIGTSVLTTAFDGGNGEAFVPVLIEIDGEDLLQGHRGGSLPVEIYVYAFDAGGGVRDFFTHRLTVDLEKLETNLRAGGFKYYGDLRLLPGSYTIRVLVLNGRSGFSGFEAVPLTVPSFAAATPVVLPPLVPQRQQWVMARQASRAAAPAQPYPFMMGDEPFVPAARPVLHTGETTTLCLVTYNLGETPPIFSGSVVTAEDASPVGDADLRVVDRPDTGIPGLDRFVMSFRARDLAPGEYRLTIRLLDRVDRRLVGSSSIRFVISNREEPGNGSERPRS